LLDCYIVGLLLLVLCYKGLAMHMPLSRALMFLYCYAVYVLCLCAGFMNNNNYYSLLLLLLTFTYKSLSIQSGISKNLLSHFQVLFKQVWNKNVNWMSPFCLLKWQLKWLKN